MNSPRALSGIVLVAIIAAWFLVAPIYSLLAPGPFDWHIGHPAALQGGGELLLLMLCMYGCLAMRAARTKIALMCALAWLYARQQGVDLSIFLVYLYAEGMLALGWMLWARIASTRVPRIHNILAAGMLGMVVWSIVLWTASAVGMGAPLSIRMLAIVVLGAALLFSHHPSIAALVWRSISRQRMPTQRIAAVLAIGLFLMLFAKASVVLDFDSMWYGLQGEEVLVGKDSLYAAQGMASVAHYYPKLYEALLLPFSGIGSVSMIFGVAIFSWLMVLLTCIAILKEFRLDKSLLMCGAILAASIPAIASIAVTAKGDAFSAWLLLVGVLGIIRFRSGKGDVWAWVAVCAVVLGIQARLSNLPYAALLLLVLGYSILRRWPSDGMWSVFRSRGAWIGLATFWLTAMVSARSLMLSGVVLVAPNQVVELQQSLGLSLKYPVGLLPPNEALERLPVMSGLWGILFDPSRFPHLIITWVGNVWFLLPLAGLLLGAAHSWRRLLSRSWPLLLIGISFFMVMFGYKLLVPAGDGNYFIVPITCLILWGVVHANGVVVSARRFRDALILVFALSGAAITLVTGSWGPGTRPFDLDMTRMPFEYERYADQGIAKADLQGVREYLRTRSRGLKVVGLERSTDNTEFTAGWWLPQQYENARSFAWQQPALVSSPASFQRYLRDARIDYVLLPLKQVDTPVDKIVREAHAEMQAIGSVLQVYHDAHYELWQVKRPYVATATLEGSGEVTIHADLEALCAAPNNGVVTIKWRSPSPAVVIEVKASPGAPASLWAEAGSSGSLTTGPWMTVGGEFVLRSSRGGEKIGRINVTPSCERR